MYANNGYARAMREAIGKYVCKYALQVMSTCPPVRPSNIVLLRGYLCKSTMNLILHGAANDSWATQKKWIDLPIRTNIADINIDDDDDDDVDRMHVALLFTTHSFWCGALAINILNNNNNDTVHSWMHSGWVDYGAWMEDGFVHPENDDIP